MITLKQLRYALAVGEHLHFKKAAESCHVSQSALSTALNELENQLGLKIFERDNKKVIITAIGQDILQRAKQVLLEVDDIYSLAQSQKSPLSFPITIGAIPTIAPYLIPKMFPLIQEEYPEADITLIEEQSKVLVEKVRKGEIDAAILALPYPIEGLLSLEFWQEDFYWIVNRELQEKIPSEISHKEIEQSRLMLLKDGHCLKDHILDVCKLSESNANQNVEATSLNTLIQMVQSRLGSTLVPKMALQQLVEDNKSLVSVHLNEASPHRRIAFIIRPNYTRMPSIEVLVDICKRALKTD